MRTIYVFSPLTFSSSLFFFTDPATTEIYTLSLHDALPICCESVIRSSSRSGAFLRTNSFRSTTLTRKLFVLRNRSEEHTSELQSRGHLVCRLLLEKKKKKKKQKINIIKKNKYKTHDQIHDM